MSNVTFFILIVVGFCFSCNDNNQELELTDTIEFGDPMLVTIQGYNRNIMEPFQSRDGNILFFNNLNAPTENTNLHWCTKINDTLFQYEGELENVNTESLEGVPTMDNYGNFFFVHTGNYEQTLSTIYQGQFALGSILDFELVENISRETAGWVNFDVEVSNEGKTLYFVDGKFDANGGPYESNIIVAKKENNQFFRADNSEEIFQYINTDDLEYAVAISKDELEICFTRVSTPLNTNSEPKIFIASRNSTNEPFTNIHQIINLTGFIEAPTYNANDSGIYYHKKEGGIHRLYYVEKQ